MFRIFYLFLKTDDHWHRPMKIIAKNRESWSTGKILFYWICRSVVGIIIYYWNWKREKSWKICPLVQNIWRYYVSRMRSSLFVNEGLSIQSRVRHSINVTIAMRALKWVLIERTKETMIWICRVGIMMDKYTSAFQFLIHCDNRSK